MKLSKSAMDQFRAAGRAGGLIGGAKAAQNMTPEQRIERARKAAKARHAKAAKNSGK